MCKVLGSLMTLKVFKHKRNERLCSKFLKNRFEKNETEYKSFKNFIEYINKRFKNTTSPNKCSSLKTSKILRKILRIKLAKVSATIKIFPKKVIVDNIAITDETQIAGSFDTFFYRNWPKSCQRN